MSRGKTTPIRIYFDADIMGLARLLAQERADFTFPSDPGGKIKKLTRAACPIASTDVKDSEWIPQVAALGWLIITRDRRIQDRKAELAAVREYGAKMVNLASTDASTKWGQLEVFMTRWREIDALVDQPGPFIYSATRRGAFRSLPLE